MMRAFKRFKDDAGFTLAELAMYGLLLGLVVATAAGILISGTIAERTVRDAFGAATQVQLASDSIETGIRNSSGYTVTVPATGNQMLRARVAQGTTSIQWRCAAWFYDAALDGGSIYYKVSNTAIPATTPASLSTWTRLISNIDPASGTDIFSVSGDQLKFAFKAVAGAEDPPASTSSSATSRAEVRVTAPCF